MPCEWCARGGYWECGEVPPDLCSEQEIITGYKIVPWEWTFAGQVELEEGPTYYVKCRPGCQAVVDENPDASPPWMGTGTLTVPQENLPVGTYDIFCRTGRGQKCWVKLQPAGTGEGE